MYPCSFTLIYTSLVPKTLFNIRNTEHASKTITIFFDANILRFTLAPCFLISLTTIAPDIKNQEQTAHNVIFMISVDPHTFPASLGGSTYDNLGSTSLLSAWCSPRFSFSQLDSHTRNFASHATSSSEMGRFIQSPLYLTLCDAWLKTLLGLNISSRDCTCFTSGVNEIRFTAWPPKKQLTCNFNESIHWRLHARLSPELACNSASARNMNSCNNNIITNNWDPDP